MEAQENNGRKYVIERSVGDVFYVEKNGKRINMEVVESKENVCNGCFFEASNVKKGIGRATFNCYVSRCGECNGFVRKDGKNVIFKKVGDGK